MRCVRNRHKTCPSLLVIAHIGVLGTFCVRAQQSARSEQHAAAEDVDLRELEGVQVHAVVEEREEDDRADEGDGDVPGDDLADDQIHAAQEQQQGGDLAQGAAGLAQEHVHNGEGALQALHVAVLHVQQRSGRGDDVSGGAEQGGLLAGGDPGGHDAGIAAQQEGTARQSGVHNVLAQAAEEHFHQHDSESVAQNDGPVGNGHGADKGQQHAGDHRGQVVDPDGGFHQTAVSPLKEYAGQHTRQTYHCRTDTEIIQGYQQSGNECDNHSIHIALHAICAVGMRR